MQKPTWSATGIIEEIRPLVSKSTGAVFSHSLKLLCPGRTIECSTRDLDKTKPFKAGDVVKAVGSFDDYKGVQFVLDSIAKAG